jgi:predicted transposase YbfD/YdcC
MNSTAILDHFTALKDPRQSWKTIYPLPEILLTILCGTMAGADDFVEISLWGQEKLAFLRRMQPFKHGIPSHDTLNDVMNALPAKLFAECFTSWVASLREDAPDIVAIDGKTSRRAHGKKGTDDARPLHLISAWATRQRLVLGQEACDEKESEISAIPRLLKRLELQGALVTIDAMGCQHGIAQAICDRGADYLLALKSNQKSLHEEVALFFKVAHDLEQHTTTDADHGRIEKRTTYVCHSTDWLSNQKKAPDDPKFPNLATIGMIKSEVEKDGAITVSTRYFISSAHLDAVQLGRAVRAHWGIENRLHWVMDVVFHDDLMRLRSENGPQNMATIRHTAMNIIKTIPGKESLKVKRKSMSWNEDRLFAAITNQHQ